MTNLQALVSGSAVIDPITQLQALAAARPVMQLGSGKSDGSPKKREGQQPSTANQVPTVAPANGVAGAAASGSGGTSEPRAEIPNGDGKVAIDPSAAEGDRKGRQTGTANQGRRSASPAAVGAGAAAAASGEGGASADESKTSNSEGHVAVDIPPIGDTAPSALSAGGEARAQPTVTAYQGQPPTPTASARAGGSRGAGAAASGAGAHEANARGGDTAPRGCLDRAHDKLFLGRTYSDAANALGAWGSVIGGRNGAIAALVGALGVLLNSFSEINKALSSEGASEERKTFQHMGIADFLSSLSAIASAVATQTGSAQIGGAVADGIASATMAYAEAVNALQERQNLYSNAEDFWSGSFKSGAAVVKERLIYGFGCADFRAIGL